MPGLRIKRSMTFIRFPKEEKEELKRILCSYAGLLEISDISIDS
jgi:hypothetical protein